MSGELYIVATPIGNLDDITLRAIETLKTVDLIAAEDTRHSKRLLHHLGISALMISLHEHNERERIARILRELADGKRLALISDAGTPLISDPGFPLVRAVIEAGHAVVPVPGASAVITALSASGLPTDRFCFHGFLPHKDGLRRKKLQGLLRMPGTHVLYESTHRIEKLLQRIEESMPEAPLVIAKELTKHHECFLRGNADKCRQLLRDDPALARGEFVILIYIEAKESDHESVVDEHELLRRLLQDLPLKTAARIAADITGRKKNELYHIALQWGKGE